MTIQKINMQIVTAAKDAGSCEWLELCLPTGEIKGELSPQAVKQLKNTDDNGNAACKLSSVLFITINEFFNTPVEVENAPNNILNEPEIL